MGTTTTTRTHAEAPSSLLPVAQAYQCQVCHKVCRPKRCQNCRAAFYCSVRCQRHDWKQHRKACHHLRAFSNDRNEIQQKTQAAQDAWKELTQLLSSSTLKEAHEEQLKALDHVARLVVVEEEEQRGEQGPSAPIMPQSEDIMSNESVLSQRHVVVSRADNAIDKNTERPTALKLVPQQNFPKVEPPVQDSSSPKSNLTYFVEDMTNLSCYQVLVRPKINSDVRAEDVSVQLVPSPNSSSATTCRCSTALAARFKIGNDRENALRINLDKCIQQYPPPRVYLVDQGKAVSIRLSYSVQDNVDNLLENEEGSWSGRLRLLQPHQANRLACRHCGRSIFLRKQTESNNNNNDDDDDTYSVIDNVLPLPSHNFDGLDDYMQCYPGQAAIQFGPLSTGAQPGRLLQDDTTLVVHANDVGDHSVCVLAIPGYGETAENDSNETEDNRDYTDARTRGQVPWREAVGGATLTCSCCASIMGVAPIELLDTFRLFQHQLVVVTTAAAAAKTVCTSSQLRPAEPVSTIARFVAHEMVRYAETKAIFTFCVCLEDSETTATGRCLMIRVLSWETRAAASQDSQVIVQQGHEHVHQLEWHRVVKVLFEETTTVTSSVKDEDTALNWIWTTNDWCCPPGTGMNGNHNNSNNNNMALGDDSTKDSSGASNSTNSQVWFYLSRQDWEELRQEIKQSAGFYAREVVEATILAKTGGRFVDIHDYMGLAAIKL